jgi:AcrR family transcriptional regulator
VARPGRRGSARTALLVAARELIAAGAAPPTAGAIATRAGVSRLTVYQQFGSLPGLLEAVAAEVAQAPEAAPGGPPVERLRRHVAASCAHWASDPALFRHLAAASAARGSERAHELASALAVADRLRPGCSLREAEDVIAVVTSFGAFDRLHQDGRRAPGAVAEILMRMTASILSPSAYA